MQTPYNYTRTPVNHMNISQYDSEQVNGCVTNHRVLWSYVSSAGAEGEAPCRAQAGVESEEKSSKRDGLRARRRTDGK